MKQLLLLLAIACAVNVGAQGVEKVFKSTNLVYYGVDFTKVKMIGFGDESPHKIRDEYFKPWAAAALEVDLAKAFQKQALFRDLNGLTKVNGERETETLSTDKEVEFTNDMITEMVKNVPVGTRKDGLAVVILAQSFNKTTETATFHVVFFDIATHNIYLTKKVTTKPASGPPIKAWAAAVKGLLEKIEKKEFDQWKKDAKY